MERPPSNRPPTRARPHRVREALPVALLALACGAVLRGPLGCARSAPPPIAARSPVGAASTSNAGLADPFAALSARGRAIAPGMREVTRTKSAGDRVEVARAGERDACVRVAFEARSPVVAKLLDAEGNVLAASEAPTIEGVLGEHGPVCIRRGDTVTAVTDGVETSVRWVAWKSP
jgi:hypothetical protein